MPEEIGDLANLEVLNLSRNKISSLPESIQELTKLKKLNIKKTNIPEAEVARIQAWLPNCEIKQIGLLHLRFGKISVGRNGSEDVWTEVLADIYTYTMLKFEFDATVFTSLCYTTYKRGATFNPAPCRTPANG